METPVELSVIVPCLDEQLNVPELVTRILRVFDAGGIAGEVILVDDGSADRTWRVIRAHEAEHPGRVVGITHGTNRGISAAWRSGAERARGQVVTVLDADLQYQPEDVLRLYRVWLDRSVDIVQGWRSPVGRERDKRYHLSRGFNSLLNVAFGMDLRDNKSGFVMCAKEVLLDLLTYTGSYRYWQSFIMVAAHAKGYTYREVETLFDKRRQGESFLDRQAYLASLRSLADLGKAVWEYRLNAEPTDVSRQFLTAKQVPLAEPPSRKARPALWRAYMGSFDRTHWMITRNVERYVETLDATQWLPPADLRELQDEKLRRLVRHAYRSVPYYRARMQELKLRPEDIRGQRDLHKLPLLGKDDVRRHLHFDILQEGASHADMLKISTSGSTGEPFVCYADRAQLEFRWAATLRSQEWTGYRFGDPTVRLWHQTLGMTPAKILRERADALFANRSFIPVFSLKADLEPVIRAIEQKNPVFLDGYAEALDLLATYVEARGGMKLPRLKGVMSSAQTLSTKSRESIERAFGCKVFDKYGSREFSGIAYESDAHDGHLVVGEGYIVELLVDGRPARPGEVGEVVVTDLNNMCLPFIRYRLGDLAEALEDRPSRCGRGMPRVGDVQGRVQSIIQGPDGQVVPGAFFGHALKEYDYAFQRFQVVQDEPGAITLKIVKAQRYSDETLEEVKALIRGTLGERLRIDVEIATDIDLVRTGKRIVALSRIPIDLQRDGLRIPPSTGTRS